MRPLVSRPTLSLTLVLLASAARAESVELSVMPRIVYRATDGVRPQWRFAAAAFNGGPDSVTLTQIDKTRYLAGRELPDLPREERKPFTLASKRRMNIVVVDDGSDGPQPDAVEIRLAFRDAGGRQWTVSRLVRIQARATTYLRFPLMGTWWAANARADQHCVGVGFGFDFVHERDKPLHDKPPARAMSTAEFASFGRTLYAPADGRILDAENQEPDFPPTPDRASYAQQKPKRIRLIFGNYLVLETAEHAFVLMAHCQQGSLLVKKGDRVRAGQPVGRVGNSGNTSGPHLHIEMLDTAPDVDKLATAQWTSSGIPFGFRDVTLQHGGVQARASQAVPQKHDKVAPGTAATVDGRGG